MILTSVTNELLAGFRSPTSKIANITSRKQNMNLLQVAFVIKMKLRKEQEVTYCGIWDIDFARHSNRSEVEFD